VNLPLAIVDVPSFAMALAEAPSETFPAVGFWACSVKGERFPISDGYVSSVALQAEPLNHSSFTLSTTLMTSDIVQRLRIAGVGIERALQIVKARESRPVLEDAGIQPAEVSLHFVFVELP
jgi:hypothetical protein